VSSERIKWHDWHYVDGDLKRLPAEIDGLSLAPDGYYRLLPDRPADNFDGLPRLIRDDGRALFVVTHLSFSLLWKDTHGSSCYVYYVDDEMLLHFNWNDLTGVNLDRKISAFQSYGVRSGEVPEAFALIPTEDANGGAPRDPTKARFGLLPREPYDRVCRALVEAWQSWPARGERGMFTAEPRSRTERLLHPNGMDWANIPYCGRTYDKPDLPPKGSLDWPLSADAVETIEPYIKGIARRNLRRREPGWLMEWCRENAAN
jgi:hypothetical protein